MNQFLYKISKLKIRFILFIILNSTFLILHSQVTNPNGYNTFYYDNGAKSSEGTMRDGKADGYWKNYYKNGKLTEKTTVPAYQITDDAYAEYAITAVDATGEESFLSEPLAFSKSQPIIVEPEHFVTKSDLDYVNYSGNGFVEISNDKNTKLSVPIVVDESGEYFITIKYSNGSGPWNTDNKCAIRSLYLNAAYAGVLVFPQRGTNEWSDWGLSNSHKVNLVKGKNQLELVYHH